MAGCGMLAGSMSLAFGNSFSFVPHSRLGSNGAGRAGGRRIHGGSLSRLRILPSILVPRGWRFDSAFRRGFVTNAAANGSNDNRGKKAPGPKDGQSRGGPEKKVDRKHKENPWTSGEPARSAKSSSSKPSGKRESGGNKSGRGNGQQQSRAAETPTRSSASGRERISQEEAEDDIAFLKHLSPPLPTENEKVIFAEESFSHPLWSTFCSSTSGVWRGVGAAFSPITAELEAISLNKEKEYLYDARILNTVELVRTSQDGEALPLDSHYLNRRVLWSLENPFGENGLGQVKVAEDAVVENARLSAFLGKGTSYNGGMASEDDLGYWEEDEDIEEDEDDDLDWDAEWEAIVGNPDDIDASWEAGKLDTVEVMPELKVDTGSIREDGKEWNLMWERDEGSDSDWEGRSLAAAETDGATGSKFSSEAFTASLATLGSPGPTYAPEHLTDALGTTWADVMEEDLMDKEEGLVFFEDGSYSRGPLELLTEASTSGREYFNAYTCKIEQCLVAGGHKRLRVVHTVSVENQGEQVEVLRVAVYEEEWMGPCNMKSISDAGGQQLKLFSDRTRHSPQDLVGSWKVFEKEAMAIHPGKTSTAEKASFVHSCKEISLTRRLPEMPQISFEDAEGPVDMSDYSMLWLTGGVSTYVDVSETGVLTFGIGWLSSNGSRLVIERVYGEDGKLLHVKSKTEIEASLGVPM